MDAEQWTGRAAVVAYFLKQVCFLKIYLWNEYTLFRHTIRRHQIPLHMVMSYHVIIRN